MTISNENIAAKGKYPDCEKHYCPFHECMGGTTCRLESVYDNAPHLIKDYGPQVMQYCSRPSIYNKSLKRTKQKSLKQD